MPANLPDALLQAILLPLATLLLATSNNDPDLAMANARATIATYDPGTEAEFRLAVRILVLSLQGGEAAAQACTPDLPLIRVIRLRLGAVALYREADKAERRIEKIRAARAQGQEQPADPLPPAEAPAVHRAAALIEETKAIIAQASALGTTWPKAYKLRKQEQRLAKQRDREAREAARALAAATPVQA